MPTNMRKIDRSKSGSGGLLVITPEVVAAWHACDSNALHSACGLHCLQDSPLPREITALGISEETCGNNRYDRESLRWQKKLLQVLGWPEDCARIYAENLKDAEETRDYCRDRVLYPERYTGEQGTGADPESRRRRLEKAEAEVAYRRELLEEALAPHSTPETTTS